MQEERNLHDGHRDRMREKLLKSPDSLSDHELLEILLYQFIPRKNTNEIAHNVLQYFGSMENLIKADAKEILAIPGIGKNTASGITLFSAICKRYANKPAENKKAKFSFDAYRSGVVSYFSGKTEEEFVFILLNDKNKEICRTSFDDRRESEVYVDLSVVAKILAINKPTGVIIAHNHPSGNLEPSSADVMTTSRLIKAGELLGINVLDHIIFSENSFYSLREHDEMN